MERGRTPKNPCGKIRDTLQAIRGEALKGTIKMCRRRRADGIVAGGQDGERWGRGRNACTRQVCIQ